VRERKKNKMRERKKSKCIVTYTERRREREIVTNVDRYIKSRKRNTKGDVDIKMENKYDEM
jgi:hypothetical protein